MQLDSLGRALVAGLDEQARQAPIPGPGQCGQDDAAAHVEGASITRSTTGGQNATWVVKEEGSTGLGHGLAGLGVVDLERG